MSELMNASSIGEVALITLCSEIGFMGVQPIHPIDYAEDITPTVSRILKSNASIINEKKTLNIIFESDSGNVNKDIEFDVVQDASLALSLANLHKNTVQTSDVTQYSDVNPTVSYLIFENSLNFIGSLLNEDDSYFEILATVWKSLDRESPYYSKMVSHKKMDLKDKFKLSEERLNMLT